MTMQAVPISNEAISDVVWAALELSDRCKGGTDIEIDILPSGAVILNVFLVGYNKSPEYRQYRIISDEDAAAALAMIQETKERKIPQDPFKVRVNKKVNAVLKKVGRVIIDGLGAWWHGLDDYETPNIQTGAFTAYRGRDVSARSGDTL